jgi:hypothetical protein
MADFSPEILKANKKDIERKIPNSHEYYTKKKKRPKFLPLDTTS